MSIRVLIVDDSVVIRRILQEILQADPDFEVVGTASDGKIALQRIAQLKPDAITLDIEMPNMDGLQTLSELRKTHPRLPVVMLSTLTRRCASATLDALSRGADDYITKPVDTRSPAESFAQVREQLLPKLKALCKVKRPSTEVTKPFVPLKPLSRSGPVVPIRPPSPDPAPGPRLPLSRIDAVVIASSTGGPAALGQVIPLLPANLPVPVFIVQHMPALFTRLLADRLTSTSAVPVDEARTGVVVEPGKVWLAPGGFHLELVREGQGVRLNLNQDAPENSCRPAADPLFRSAAAIYGAHTLGVVLTGMGQDGMRGCEAIRAAGGQVVVQDEASSVVWGMPGFVARSGIADRVLPLGLVAREIFDRLRLGRSGGLSLNRSSIAASEGNDVHQRR